MYIIKSFEIFSLFFSIFLGKRLSNLVVINYQLDKKSYQNRIWLVYVAATLVVGIVYTEEHEKKTNHTRSLESNNFKSKHPGPFHSGWIIYARTQF